MWNILLADDDREITNGITDYIGISYSVQKVFNGEQLKNFAKKSRYDVIIVDNQMPILSGLESIKSIRLTDQETPIMVISGDTSSNQICRAFSYGADDYVCKPFRMQELKARLDRLIKRPPREREDAVVLADLKITSNHEVFRGKYPITLRKVEYMILKYLVQNKDRIVTRQQLINYAWLGRTEPSSAAVDVHISNLRKKVNPGNTFPPIIKTVHGFGFRIVEEHNQCF